MSFFHIFWLVLAIFVWGFIHSLTASLQFKAYVHRKIGPISDRYYRLGYNLFTSLSLAIVLILAAFTPDQTLYVVTFPWVILLIVIEFLALFALMVGLWQTDILDFLGARQLRESRRRPPSRLVTNGLYHYVRHPLYSSGLILIWALPLMTARLLVVDLALTVYIVIGAYFEERKLRQKFSNEYTDYAAVTPMFIPFLKKIRFPHLVKNS